MFDTIDGKITINASTLNIPEFKGIWKRDKGRAKLDAHAELSYIYYMCDYKSEFRNLPEEEKIKKLTDTFITPRLGDKWKADAKIEEAMKLYRELQETPSLRFLNSVTSTLDKLSEYLGEAEIEDGKDGNITQIMAAIEKGQKIVSGLAKLKESVSKEVSESSRLRGGGEVGKYED